MSIMYLVIIIILIVLVCLASYFWWHRQKTQVPKNGDPLPKATAPTPTAPKPTAPTPTPLLPRPNPNQLSIESEPSTVDLVADIKDQFLDTDYRFNLGTQPVVSINLEHDDKKRQFYRKQLQRAIDEWGYHIQSIKPIFSRETDSEFVAEANVSLKHLGRARYFTAKYYGHMDRPDDMYRSHPSCTMQLIALKEISKRDFGAPKEKTQDFMTQAAQESWVRHVQQLHQDELAHRDAN